MRADGVDGKAPFQRRSIQSSDHCVHLNLRWQCRVCNQHLKVWRSKIIQSLMDEELDPVLSFLNEEEGWDDEYSSISEFKHHLKEDTLADEAFKYAWVFWRESEQHKITTLFKHLPSAFGFMYFCMAQFWSVVKVEGRRHYLSTSHQSFYVSNLRKGLCWYRKQCMDHMYRVEEDGPVEEAELGGVGRAYRNKHPESTPDLRLYSTKEFPLRDHAARCGFRSYLALPLFDLDTNECCGVLELLSDSPGMDTYLISSLYQQLQIAGLRSTHINCNPISRFKDIMVNPDKYKQQVAAEIKELLETVIQALPRLSLAQVWVYCKCVSNCCMERASFIAAPSKIVNSCYNIDGYIFGYLKACEFHHLQLDRNHFHQNLKGRSISKSPLEHYAQMARLSHCFAIYMQSVDNSNDPFVIEFFLQPECRELHLLSRIIEMKLKSFTFQWEGELLEIFESSEPNEIECESIDMLKVMNSYEEKLSESNFKEYMDSIDDTCCQRPTSANSWEGWVFSCSSREKLYENQVNSNTIFVPVLMKERIEEFMKKMAIEYVYRDYWIVQFWAPKMAEGRCYLETSAQPYALGCLAKGLASFRKECMKHHYFVDDEAKEEELGPPGRVFRNKHIEITPDLLLYSTKEFPMRNYAMHCCLQEYLVLPVFDELKHKCAGVLEFIGFDYFELEDIGTALKAAKLRSTDHIHFQPRFISHPPATIINCRKMALEEVNDAFCLITDIPHLHMAKMWVPYEKCAFISSNARCMELASSTNRIDPYWGYMPTDEVHWIHVQPRKGIIDMALESESKSCFCQDLSGFNIIDQPLALNDRIQRLDVCFAICLQSSLTGDLTYVLEFFLKPSPQYLESFFRFLLPIMKLKLKSFKYACGKQLGEELVVDVIQFSEANNLAFPKLGQRDDVPIKFRSVQYCQMEHQQAEEPVQYVSKKTQKGKRKTGFHLSLEDLKPHFGKKLKDVAEELGVGRSTIKRACRYHNIERWPCNEKQTRKPSLYEKEKEQESEQDVQPSSTGNLRQLDTSLQQNGPRTNIESLIVQEEVEKVMMIKVRSDADIIKFELCLSLGVGKLLEEVATRLNLKMGTFKLKYLDEDNDEILVTCDADLQLCIKSQKTVGKTCIELFLR